MLGYQDGRLTLIQQLPVSEKEPIVVRILSFQLFQGHAEIGGRFKGAQSKALSPNFQILQEFQTKTSLNTRKCNAIAWNPVEKNRIAAGYDKGTPKEQSCLVWDVNKKPEKPGFLEDFKEMHDPIAAGEVSRVTLQQKERLVRIREPVTSMIKNDDVYSLAWQPDSASILISGAYQVIRVMDIRETVAPRDPYKGHKSYVEVIKFDPFNSRVFACSGEDGILRLLEPIGIKIYDLRKLT